MKEKRRINIIGMGPGNEKLLSKEAICALEGAELVIGAQRVVQIYPECTNKPCFFSYKAEEIIRNIKDNPEYKDIALLYSGDVGFFSGAQGIVELLKQEGEKFETKIFPGISAPIYMMDKLGISWEDARLVSNHGRCTNMISLIRDNRKVCTLLGLEDTVSEICSKLLYYGLPHVNVIVGERLSYEDEKLTKSTAKEMIGKSFDKLSVALFINENPLDRALSAGILDDEFIRGKVPMTKQEVRALAISKLCLKEASVLYDIGAGTGSVAVEAARLMEQGIVYAIEKNKEGVSLIEENKRKFMADNIIVVEGQAPAALDSLPVPTHAFVGGSGGNLVQIIGCLLEKNPSIRCVITAVTLETIAELDKLIESFSQCEDMELVQISAARGKKLGAYHLIKGENPVYIAAFGG